MNTQDQQNGNAGQTFAPPSGSALWYIACVPKKQRDKADEEMKMRLLLAGPEKAGEDKNRTIARRLMWVALAMNGIADHREEKVETWRQRPMIFTDRASATRWARKRAKENDSWRFMVREARLMPNARTERRLPPPQTTESTPTANGGSRSLQ